MYLSKAFWKPLGRYGCETHNSTPFWLSRPIISFANRELSLRFRSRSGEDGAFEFGVDESGRAFIEETIERSGRCRMLLFLVWQAQALERAPRRFGSGSSTVFLFCLVSRTVTQWLVWIPKEWVQGLGQG